MCIILYRLYSVQHWRSTATCAAALGLPNLNYEQVTLQLDKYCNMKQKRAKEEKKSLQQLYGTKTKHC